jgi:DNA-binding YbaB/EbfC family protein
MNIQQMMKQAQEMQVKMQELQAQLAETEIQGQAGGGLVKVTLTAGGVMLKLDINSALLKPEEKETLEDLIIAAHADAKERADETIASETGRMMQGMNLPPGMKLPGQL